MMGPMGSDPFTVNEAHALSALGLAWADEYDIWVIDGKWQAVRTDNPDGEELSGDTPDELSRAIRDDWRSRALRRGLGIDAGVVFLLLARHLRSRRLAPGDVQPCLPCRPREYR
jgi:hypothetical protein